MLEKGSGSQTEPLTPIVPVKGSVGTPISQMRKQAQAQLEEAALAQGLGIHRLAEHEGASEAGVPRAHDGGAPAWGRTREVT